MPNHCKNLLTVVGKPAQVARFVALAAAHDGMRREDV